MNRIFHSWKCMGTYITALCFWLLAGAVAYAQPRQIDSALAGQLANKTKLEDIMNTVLSYYQSTAPQLMNADATAEAQKGNPVTKWARWALMNANRLDEQGNITDYAVRNFYAAMEANKAGLHQVPIEQNSNVGSWTFIGPTNTAYGTSPQNFRGLGRVDRIAFHPTDANTIYIGTPAGGLWRTTDNGTNWTNLTRYLPSPGISGIVVNSDNPNIIYILTGDGDSNLGGGLVNLMGYVRRSVGVLRSDDGGTTWRQTSELPNSNANTVGYKLVQNPTNANILIAATNDGLYRTTNGGTSWTRVRTGRFWDVAFRHNSNTTVYATGDGADRFIRSTNGGETWGNAINYDPANTAPVNTGRGQIGVGVSATAVVYVLWGGVTGEGSFRGLYRSGDAGVTFARQTTTPNVLGNDDDGQDDGDQSAYDMAMAVRPTNSAHITVAGTTLWGSTNSGTTMVKRTSFRESGTFAYIHPDVHDVRYHPTSGWLYAATDGGMYRSNDNGVTWTDISPGINTTQFYRGSGFDADANVFIGGTQDNGVLYRPNNTNTFRFVLCCDGFDAKLRPNDATQGYTSMNDNLFRLNNLNGGGTGIRPTVNRKWFHNIATHPTNGAILYVGADSFHRSTNGGTNYVAQVAVNMGWYLTSCPSNTDRLYGAGGNSPWAGTGNIRRSDNRGDTWTNINGTTFAPTNLKVTCIGVRPNNSAHVWATLGGFNATNKVFRTTDGGANPPTWTNMTGSLPNVPVNCVVVDANNNAYIGTDIGVYYRGSNMNDWVPFFNFLPRVPVTSLILNEDAGTIRAVTFGRGVWQSAMYSTCPAILSVGSIFGYKVYEAGTELNINGTVSGGAITEAYAKSGNRINLLPGFAALSNNEIFRAYIAPCGNGIPTPGSAGDTPETVPRPTLTTNFPFGSILATPTKAQRSITIQVPEAAIYSLHILSETDTPVGILMDKHTLQPGEHTIPIAVASFSGAFKVVLLQGDVVADIKEL